jgi:hypothetical protein
VTLATAIVAALAFLAGDPLPGAAGAVPPPVAQVAADCRTPIYASDVVVCGDPTLLRLDNRMREMLGRGGPEIGGQEGSLVESQEAWFRRRSLCAFSVQQAACLEAAYAERLAVLDALSRASEGASSSDTLSVCPNAPWGPKPVRVESEGQAPVLLRDSWGRVLAVASFAGRNGDWSPYLRYQPAVSGFRLEPLDGVVINCDPH